MSYATTNGQTAAKAKKANPIGGVASWVDDRTGIAAATKKQVRKVFPDHWSFMLGEIALWSFVVLLRDTGPLPEDALSTTVWKAGTRLTLDPTGEPVKAENLTIGSIVHIMPEGIEETEHVLDERAKAAVLLVRLNPTDLAAESEGGSYEGILAYSKICTHMGCPVALYEQQTHHLLCPCHQSTFDLTDNCKVIFGPARRPLPQLPITVDEEGYLVAKEGFSEAVGPSFWERG